MAISDMNKATWTFVHEAGNSKRQLPWARMAFGDAGEEGTVFVVPLPISSAMQTDLPVAPPSGIVGLTGRQGDPDYAPNSPFPYEGARPSRSSGPLDADRYAGPVAIHYFGGI